MTSSDPHPHPWVTSLIILLLLNGNNNIFCLGLGCLIQGGCYIQELPAVLFPVVLYPC